MAWQQPDAAEVEQALRRFVAAKAGLRVAQLELDMYEASIALSHPRNTAVRKVGFDDTSARRLQELHSAVLQAEREVDEAEATVTFLNYAKEMYKADSYRGARF